jgi:regulator of protease activity HflC (stomatin/prohibitin superfamily)
MIRLIVLALIFFLIIKSIKIVKESERLVVFRLGRFFKIAGPGFVIVIPVVDRCAKINLEEKIPGWQTLPEMEFRERLKAIAKEAILK